MPSLTNSCGEPKFVVLPPVDLIYSHLPQWRLAAVPIPPFQVTHIDGAHRRLRQLESPRHLAGSGTLAGLSDNLFEPLAEWRFGGQLLDFFHSHAAFRTSEAVHLHDHRRPINAPWQVADLSLPDIVHVAQSSPASTALKSPMDRLSPHPQFKRFRLFVQLDLEHSVPRPSQNRRPLFVRQLLSLAKNIRRLEASTVRWFLRIPAERPKNKSPASSRTLTSS
jgi:hypothetical protein